MSSTNAQEFYGNAFTSASSARKLGLEKAYKFLDMAIRSEAGGEANVSKTNMAFNAALKHEADAFATA